MRNNIFIAAGEVLDTSMSVEELEYLIQTSLDEDVKGFASFYVRELSPEKVVMEFKRDALIDSTQPIIYDHDMSLLTGIDVKCFQLKPIGDPMIFPLALDATRKSFYTATTAFLRFYKNLLVWVDAQGVEDLGIRCYADKIRFQIIF